MTDTRYTGEKSNTSYAVRLIGGLAIVSAVAALSFALGVFDRSETTTEDTASITVSSDRLDFGSVLLNEAVNRRLVLLNEGSEPVDARIRVRGTGYRVDPEEILLHPGISAAVSVELLAHTTGDLDDALEILIDGKLVAPLSVSLTASVLKEFPSENPTNTSDRAIARSTVEAPVSSAPVVARNTTRRTDRAVTPPKANRPSARNTSRGKPAARPKANTANGVTAQPGTAPTAPQAGAAATSRRPASAASRRRGSTEPSGDTLPHPGMGVVVKPFDPANSAPTTSLSEVPTQVSQRITPEEADRANAIPSKLDGELPDTLPDEPAGSDDDDDIFDNDRDDDPVDPFESPALMISGQSTIRLMGSQATFYPQEVGILGTDMGGSLTLVQSLQLPTVPLAFGESMLFTQSGPTAAGGFDATSGSVELQLVVQAVDSDGNAAPMTVQLTTGTVLARNERGVVVSMTGTPRSAGSGLLRLVGIGQIPVGYRNGGEQHLAVFEILASLDFGNSIGGTSSPRTIGRIGG